MKFMVNISAARLASLGYEVLSTWDAAQRGIFPRKPIDSCSDRLPESISKKGSDGQRHAPTVLLRALSTVSP